MSDLRIIVETSIDQFLYSYLSKERSIAEKRIKTIMRELKNDPSKRNKIKNMITKNLVNQFDYTDFAHLEGIGSRTSYKAADGLNHAIPLLKSNDLIENSKRFNVINKKYAKGVDKESTNNHIEELEEDLFTV